MARDRIPITEEEMDAIMRNAVDGNHAEFLFGPGHVELAVSEQNLWAIRLLGEMRMPVCI
jgi:hypothetical protein